MAKVVGTWEGGRVVEKSDGTRVYYIRKRLAGKLYEVSTGATTLKAALAHLQRFQANPEGYSASGALPGQPVTIQAFQRDYLAYCKAKGNSQNWITQKRRYLSWWREAFPDDLRNATREQLLACVNGATVPHNRIASLKAFCSWLRDVRGVLPKGQDATLDLPIPALKPAQWKKLRAITREVFTKTMEHVDPAYVDILTMIAGTGMHTTEAARLAKGQGSVSGTTLTIFHKGGAQHRMEVEPHVAQAATRVLARGSFSVSRLMKAIKEACDKAGVERWAPGCLRHSFITWLVGDGASIEAVAAYTNHDVATLKRYYNVAPIPRPALARTA